MDSVNLRAVDLQLLVALDVLLHELHVTRAAKSLGLSQPAMSHVLARLRDLFGDPLLVRTAKGLAPTARALKLKDPVREALRHVQLVFETGPAFDPRTTRESFVVRMGDMNEFLVLPAIARELEKRAPNISLEIRHLPPLETVRALDADEVQFAVSTGLEHPRSIRSVELLKDEMVCIMRREHPSARYPLSLSRFLALKHIRIVQTASDTRFVDEHLSREPRRQVALSIPHWLVAPSLVESTDLVTVISRRFARSINARDQFEVRALPVGPKSFSWQLYWHSRYDAHPAHNWMRALVQRACAKLA